MKRVCGRRALAKGAGLSYFILDTLDHGFLRNKLFVACHAIRHQVLPTSTCHHFHLRQLQVTVKSLPGFTQAPTVMTPSRWRPCRTLQHPPHTTPFDASKLSHNKSAQQF